MPLTWYELRNGEFVAHKVAEKSFGHGIGAGDINKDGLCNVIDVQRVVNAALGGQCVSP